MAQTTTIDPTSTVLSRPLGITKGVGSHTIPDTVAEANAPMFFGKYRYERFLGRGGMGIVYLVVHTYLSCQRALKLIPAGPVDHSARRRFEQEAQILARVSASPYIVQVHDACLTEHSAYIEMEYVPGRNLKEVLREGGAMARPRAVKIIMQLCEALRFAHRAGVVHRDLKPSNMMLYESDRFGRDSLKLLDYGVAKVVDESGCSASREGLKGTLLYASPEQIMGAPVDARTDIYSAGVVLYELLTGHRPFDAPTEIALANKILRMSPPRFAEWRAATPTHPLEDLVMSCLAKEPALRPQSATDLAGLLWTAARP